jgi:glycosyltransferase involved in cell wall biosynthesis
MRVLMLVATSVATDNRVLREARILVDAGHPVHIVGKDVPPDFVPPEGVTVSSAGASSVFRPAGSPSASARPLSAPKRFARWVLLPQHRNQAFGSWAKAAVEDARTRGFDVVHAHDFTALEAGAALADERGVPYVYDAHEHWQGRQRQHRPTPLQDRHEREVEGRLGRGAARVITVGDGIARLLSQAYGWTDVAVVRNSFPRRDDDGTSVPEAPSGLVYAGRIDAHRDLETVLEASSLVPDLPVTLVGPAVDVWVTAHAADIAAAGAVVEPSLSVAGVTELMRARGIALVPLSDAFESHQMAMPNKIFHAVHAGVPVVATEVAELAAVVREHDLGELYRSGDAASLAAAVERVRARYPDLLRSVAAAAGAMSWDADAEVLREVYTGLATVG